MFGSLQCIIVFDDEWWAFPTDNKQGLTMINGFPVNRKVSCYDTHSTILLAIFCSILSTGILVKNNNRYIANSSKISLRGYNDKRRLTSIRVCRKPIKWDLINIFLSSRINYICQCEESRKSLNTTDTMWNTECDKTAKSKIKVNES